MPAYQPREKNVIQEILHDHFSLFEENYDTQYSKKYGQYRIIRIKESVEKFIECRDYSKGIARIKCTNTHCGHEYFQPFVASLKGACKNWYLCPSCNQKRLLLFSEHLSENVLLNLPHQQFVFTLPKLLPPYFKHALKKNIDVKVLSMIQFGEMKHTRTKRFSINIVERYIFLLENHALSRSMIERLLRYLR